MSVKCDSCGAYYRVGQLADRYADISLATSLNISLTGGAGGRPCWDLGTGICAIGDAIAGSLTSMSVGCRFKLPALPSTNPFTLVAFWETGGVVHDSMRVNTSGLLEVGRGLTGNVLGTGAHVVAANRWYYAEITLLINSSTGTVRAILWDDVGIRYDEIALSAQNTRNGGTSGIINRVYFGPQLVPGGFAASASMMDLYQLTSGNSWATTLLGPVRVVAQQSSADGFYSGSTIAGSSAAATRWQSVHEVPSDEDVTTVTNVASTATKDTYSFGTISAEDTIWFVQPVVRARISSSSLTLTPVARSAGVDGNISFASVTGAAYKFYLTGTDVDVAHASVPWTRKSFSTGEFGWSVAASALVLTITQMVVEVVLSDIPRTVGLVFADGFDDIAATGTSIPAGAFAEGGSSGGQLPTGGVNGKVCLNSQQLAPGAAANVQPRFRIMIGFKFKYGQNPNQNWLPLAGVSQLIASGLEKPQCWVGIGTTGKIEVRRGVLATDTLLDNSQNAPSVATWHQVLIDFTVDGSAGAVVITMDGVIILTLTSVNTVASAGTTNGRIDRVSVGAGALGLTSGNPWATLQTFGASFDDWFAIDPTGGINHTDPGFCTVEALLPAGAGALSGSSIAGTSPAVTRWQGVNEVPPDDSVTRNDFTAAAQEDLYTLSALSGVYTVFGVAVRLRASNSTTPPASGQGALYAVLRLGSSGADAVATSAPRSLANGTYGSTTPRGFDADPNGNPWTYPALATLEAGARRTDGLSSNDQLTTLAVQVLRSDAVRSPPGAVVARAWVLS